MVTCKYVEALNVANASVRICFLACLFLLFLSTSCFLLHVCNHPKQIPSPLVFFFSTSVVSFLALFQLVC